MSNEGREEILNRPPEYYWVGRPPPPVNQVRAKPATLGPGEATFENLDRAIREYRDARERYTGTTGSVPRTLEEAVTTADLYDAVAHAKGRWVALRLALRWRAKTPGLLDEPPVPMTLGLLRAMARALVDGALGNRDVQDLMADAHYGTMWTEERIRRHPPVRVEYEHTVVISGIGEGLAIGRGKNWGDVIGMLPLEPDDPVHPTRMLYLYKDSNPYNRRFEQREAMRERLPSCHRKLVTRALRSFNRGRFVEDLTDVEIAAIRDSLGLTPAEFWRMARARGRATMKLARQCLMFP